MNSELIERWNNVVGEDDIVFHLGDFILRDATEARKFFKRLNGNIRMVAPPWHHDRKWLKSYNSWSYNIRSRSEYLVEVFPTIHILEHEAEVPIVMCHYPFAIWDRKHYGSYHLHAHSHGNYHGEGLILDVGVDNAYKLLGEFAPFSLNFVKNYMKNKEDNKND